MNLKNSYLLKKLLKWANKKCKNFNTYNVNFLKKNTKKNTWRYHYFTPAYQNPWWYDLRYRLWQTEIDNYGSFFAFLIPNTFPLKTPKITIFKKWTKLLGISSFYMCTKNHNHLMHDFWAMECDRQIFCHFGPFFPFQPPENPEDQKSEKWKNYLEMSSFYT